MSTQDITGQVGDRVRARIGRLRKRMATKIPYGPNGAKMNPHELRMKLQDMDPVRKMQMQQNVGPDEWARMMEALYGG